MDDLAALSSQILDRAATLLERAAVSYQLPAKELAKLTFSTDLRGRAAGKIEFHRAWRNRISRIKIRFNLEAARLSPDHMLNDVIPHELAHLVVFLTYGRKQVQPHGEEWQQICQQLGGSAEVTHQLELQRVRQHRRWLYRDSLGQEHALTTVRHNRLQKGGRYQVRASGATILADGFVKRLD